VVSNRPREREPPSKGRRPAREPPSDTVSASRKADPEPSEPALSTQTRARALGGTRRSRTLMVGVGLLVAGTVVAGVAHEYWPTPTPEPKPKPEPVSVPAPEEPPPDEPPSAAEEKPLKAKRRRPVKTRKGSLHVQTRPPTEVFVDGRSQGRTPWAAPIQLAAGSYVVEMRDAKVGIRYSQKVDLKPGGSVTVDKSFGRGALQVFALPFGEVFLDGKSRGLTPLDEPISLYEGRHVVRVICERTGKEETQRVTVRAGETKRLNVDLR